MKNLMFVFFGVCALSSSFFVESAHSKPQPKFRLALPGYKFQFPRDHGSHPQFATEWWYYTGHLKSQNGRRFGYQMTWFRTALTPKVTRKSAWATRDIIFCHIALTDEGGQKFFFSDRIGRANLGLSGATEGFSTKNQAKLPRIYSGDWSLQFGGKTGEKQSFRASAISDAGATAGQNFALSLSQTALKPPVIQGERGVSQKSAGRGQASHYYSFTRLATRGILTLGLEKLSVSGQSWFDHEFGSSQLSPNQIGWDWFSLQLSDGRELMLYRLRLKNGGIEPFSSGTLVERSGRSRHLKLADFRLTPLSFWKSDATGATYPARWKIEVPREDLRLEVSPTLENQELRPKRSGANLSYWEGSVSASGTQNGRAISAAGYLEMTGYASAFQNTF
ncbi:putative secreted hydrolase [Abditibacterium utsteinense]|uniref:Putative secreted hydrolase n=1 Tax=Abditibacterium utsteinense TaxID=1960156 RepID=A0A2S8SQ95_9BACT|nr:lipocalin-like domain-containing protein [Abditibacterium utsteinense]PQV62972.1 putative secreted hydrolase [Abditibacterium utsteinense]